MVTPASTQLMELARKLGMIRIREARENGFHPELIRRLVADGQLARVDRAIYMPINLEPSPGHSLALAAKRVPRGVICLLSALRYHEIGTQDPREVWIAIDNRAWKPTHTSLRLRFVRFSNTAMTEGIECHTIDGVEVPIYSPAKTVVDCFRYRNKLGLDVAIEALREGLRDRRFTRDELWANATACRVSTIIRPYLEAMT